MSDNSELFGSFVYAVSILRCDPDRGFITSTDAAESEMRALDSMCGQVIQAPDLLDAKPNSLQRWIATQAAVYTKLIASQTGRILQGKLDRLDNTTGVLESFYEAQARLIKWFPLPDTGNVVDDDLSTLDKPARVITEVTGRDPLDDYQVDCEGGYLWHRDQPPEPDPNCSPDDMVPLS